MRTMKAVVLERPGAPEVLELQDRPIPEVKPGWVLIRVKAFGLNRSEMFTRQGHSPSVKFPRIPGIECVGVVEASMTSTLQPGQTVAAAMGGMGRQYDGSYAEYTLVPETQVIALHTQLPWTTLAALPETFLTAWGSLIDAVDLQSGQTLLIRGGTSSVGMAAISLARDKGAIVLATTRNPAKVPGLLQQGAHHCIIDDGHIEAAVKQIYSGGVDVVLELVGVTTLFDSFRVVRRGGILCNSGILGNSWTIPQFEPLAMLPSTVKFTVYGTDAVSAKNSTVALQTIVDAVQQKRYHLPIDRIFPLHEIVQAHQYMEDNRAQGKLVITISD
ncbi:zinc-binding alcohol dehydrogenase family protein [Tengunoibacter tsumagoiensis]|uniref:NADPH:quinone reductase n=1 Tax=Tengunoibacter tsumagoiensis TaxID=2014871 RepID=A0A402A939_9CHLR|nr:zinc-binding alcohol dehydrogenase family protein [Tengunoibacter tsumagoiensis]GCE15618.1 NADPH:quinone reductase [Tengunoibacter tsumagoiensis]